MQPAQALSANEVREMKDEENEEKMTESIPVGEAPKMLPLDQLKETVVAQYGDDA